MFTWDQHKEEAAVLLALGELTIAEIADKVDVTDRTIYVWKTEHEFMARVTDCKAEIRERVFSEGIADKALRIRRLDKRWKAIDRLIEARAFDLAMHVAGGDTGLLAHEQKSIGAGDLATVVDVYKADTALLKEEREIAKQAAIELGQWTEKVEHDISKLSDAELISRAKACFVGAFEAQPESDSEELPSA